MAKPAKLQDVFKGENGEQILFFQVPLKYQMYMNTLTQSEKDVYIYFMTQVHYEHSLKLERDYENIMFYTGIKTKEAVSHAIKGLARKGWIENIEYQKQAANIYTINLEPHINRKLLEKIEKRKKNTSKAKKSSIQNGEAGKFKGYG